MYICKNSPFPFFYNFPKTHRRCLVQSWAWWVSVPWEDFILPLNRCASCGVGRQFPVYHGAAGGKLDRFGKLILFELSISLPWRLLVEREPKVRGSKNPAVSFKNVSACEIVSRPSGSLPTLWAPKPGWGRQSPHRAPTGNSARLLSSLWLRTW